MEGRKDLFCSEVTSHHGESEVTSHHGGEGKKSSRGHGGGNFLQYRFLQTLAIQEAADSSQNQKHLLPSRCAPLLPGLLWDFWGQAEVQGFCCLGFCVKFVLVLDLESGSLFVAQVNLKFPCSEWASCLTLLSNWGYRHGLLYFNFMSETFKTSALFIKNELEVEMVFPSQVSYMSTYSRKQWLWTSHYTRSCDLEDRNSFSSMLFIFTLGHVEWTGVALAKMECPVNGYKVLNAREGFVCLNTFKVETYSIYMPGYRRDSVTKLWVGSRLQRSPCIFGYVHFGCL